MTDAGDSDDEGSHPSNAVPEAYDTGDDELTETELRLLLRDHESVGEDARYRDRLLHTGFYLSLIFAGILLDTGVRLLGQERFLLLSGVAGFGAIAYYILWVWTKSFFGARNAAWNRRRQIEYELASQYPGHLKGHVDVFNRLTFTDDHEFEHRDRSGQEAQSGGDLTQFLIKLEFSSAAVISGLAFWYGTTRLIGRPLLAAIATILLFGFLSIAVVRVGLGEDWTTTIDTVVGRTGD